jgi:hypothetical protein
MSRPYSDGRRPTNQANRLPSAASFSTATCRYRIGVREFIPTRKHDVSDDHLKVHDVAKIRTCAIIDFDDPHWRTEQDTPLHCSPLALPKVGWVMLDWLGKAK